MTSAQTGRTILVTMLMLLACQMPWTMTHGLTLGTWSRSPGGTFMEAGTYGYAGGTFGLTPRLEAETFTVFQITPSPFSDTYGGAALSAALASPREYRENRATLFLNMYLTAGYIRSLTGSSEHALFVRFTPLGVGGPYYRTRERGASIGVLYSLTDQSWSLFWNLFLLDYYL